MRRTTIFNTLLLAAALAAAFASSATASEQGVNRARGFLDALTAGDAPALAAYMRTHFAPRAQGSAEDWEEAAGRLVEDFGDLELVRVEVDGADQVDVIARSGDGLIVRFGFPLEGEAQLLGGFSVDVGDRDEPNEGASFPPLSLPSDADEAAVRAALTSYFDQLGADGLFSGTALVAKDGKIIFETAQGLASQRFGVPNHLGTRFNLGSINKSFTKIAIGQLLAAGKLALSDTLADHLPDYPNREVARQITLEQLLDHSSGLGDFFTERFARSSRALYRSPRDYFPAFADEPLLFAPGSKRRYSNAGYVVLGAVIEAVSGQPYDAYIAEHVFAPAGMTDAGLWALDEPVPDIAIGYTVQDIDGTNPQGALRNNTFVLPIKGSPAGSAYATARDLLHFDRALRAGRLLPAGYTEWFFGEEPAPDAPATSFDQGIGIAGGAPGVSAVMESDGRMTVVVLSNFDEPGGEVLGQKLRRALRRFMG